MKEYVLLTGGMGFIGSHTAVCLLKAGVNVVIADDLSNSSASVLDGVEAITGVRPPFVRCDCADRTAVDRVFDTYPVSAVIHFAGYKAVGESVEKPLAYYRNNLNCLLTVLDAMRDHGVNTLVFSSSATVYGEGTGRPFTESSPTGGCTNPYGQTKLMAEQILKDLCRADARFTAVLLRYFNPVGADESGLIGETPRGVPNNLMPYVMQVADGRLPHLRVYGNDYPTPDGTGVRDYIHISDLASGHLAALTWASSHPGCHAFNLGTGTGTSVLELVHTFERVNGVAVPRVVEGRRSRDTAVCLADPSLANRVLGWRAERTLEDMCRDAWRWEKKQNEGTAHE